MPRGPKRGSGQRSNMYSMDKFSNWTRFDPFGSEVDTVPWDARPRTTFKLSDDSTIGIIVRDVHPRFIAPVTAEDVCDMLRRVPEEFVRGLKFVALLGGTAKQEKVALGRLFRYGSYGTCRIFLYAYPKRLLRLRRKRLPRPHIVQEYERVGATYTHDSRGWVLEFTREALRAFFLYDVLLHEIGHHVDPDVFRRKNAKAERFAQWFAQFTSQRLAERRGAQVPPSTSPGARRRSQGGGDA